MGKFKMAFVGCGGRANQVIYPAFHMLEDVEMAAICDIDPDRLQKTADKYGIPRERRYGGRGVFDYQRMLGEVKPDGVAIIGNPHIMFDLWMWALDNGFNLYIEKPFGITLHQAKVLNWMAEKNSCTTQVSFQRRCTPLVTYARAECLKKGPIEHGLVRWYKGECTPYPHARDRMMDDGIHAFDTIRWICGGEVTGVKSMMKNIGTPDLNFINAIIEFSGGAVGNVMCNWASGKRVFEVEMHVKGIYAVAEHEGKALIWRDGNLEPEIKTTQEAAGSNDFTVYTGVLHKAREFIDCCRGKTPCESGFHDALKTMELCETVLAQHTLASL